MPGLGYGRADAVKRAAGQPRYDDSRDAFPGKPNGPAMEKPALPPQASPMARANIPATPPSLPPQAAPVAQERFGMRPQLNQGVPLTSDAIRMQEMQRKLNAQTQARVPAMDELFSRRMV